MTARTYSPFDKLLINVDQALRTVAGVPNTTERAYPAQHIPETELKEEERRLAAALMRVNHAGEVSAQGLYQGQTLTARLPEVREKMERAAREENDHLAWCEARLKELGDRVSVLNPLWYAGSFAIGAAAGLAGDRWSLGFVAETENQVINHLTEHLDRLPPEDARSRAIVRQMREDETHHGNIAVQAGGAELPRPVRLLMKLTSKIMTTVAHRV